MLPRSNVELSWDIDFGALREPSDNELDYGGFGTRQYARQLVVEATWEEAADWLANERDAVDRLGRIAHDEDEFDDLAEAKGDGIIDELEGFVTAPDLGVRAAVTALCAAGCVTASSCRGHPGDLAWAPYPVILFTADGKRARVLEQACRTAECGISSTDDGHLKIWAQSVVEMLDLAAVLIAERSQFDVIPLPATLRRARGLPGSWRLKAGRRGSDNQGKLF